MGDGAPEMADEPAVRYNTAALVRACAAYYYYVEAAKYKCGEYKIVLDKTIETAKQRVRCVLVGWIIERIAASRRPGAGGQAKKWAEIPWTVGPTQLTAGKYRAAVFLALEVVKNGRAVPARAAVRRRVPKSGGAVRNQPAHGAPCRHGRAERAGLLEPGSIDPIALSLQIGADWAQDVATPLLERVAHLKAHAARAVWEWTSDSAACPPGLEGPYEEGSRRYAGDGAGRR